MKTTQEIAAIIAALKELYPDAACSLDYGKDYELLFSVRLAAQCTDARVNLVTPALFARYPTLESFAAADVDEVGRYVQSCGFWRAKARDIVGSAKMLVERFGGKVPDNMEDLLSLPGVGRKTANLILGDIYGKDGYVCDTHCIRITGRLGLTDGSRPIVSNFPCTGMHGGKLFLRSDCRDILFPGQVVARPAVQDELREIEPYLHTFCRLFGGRCDALLRHPFTVVTPNSTDPYRQLYVTN